MEIICFGEGVASSESWLPQQTRIETSDPLSEKLALAARDGRTSIVSILLKSQADPRSQESACLRWAVVHNHVHVTKILLNDGRADPRTNDNQCIRWALQNRSFDLVKLLLNDPRVIPDSEIFILACESGCERAVELLLACTRVKWDVETLSQGFAQAARVGCFNIIHLLFGTGFVDISINDFAAIRWAAVAGHSQIVLALLELVGKSTSLDAVCVNLVLNTALQSRQVEVAVGIIHSFRDKIYMSDVIKTACKRSFDQIIEKTVCFGIDSLAAGTGKNELYHALCKALEWSCDNDRVDLIKPLARITNIQREYYHYSERACFRFQKVSMIKALQAFDQMVTDSLETAALCVSIGRSTPMQSLPKDIVATILALAYGDSLIVNDPHRSQHKRAIRLLVSII